MFQMPKIEPANYYVSLCLRAMEEDAVKKREEIEERFKKSLKTKGKDDEEVNLDKRKDLELEKIRFLNRKVNIVIRNLAKKIPELRKQHPIYVSLQDTSEVPVSKVEMHRRTLTNIAEEIDNLSLSSEHKIKKAKTHKTINFIMKKYLGRVNSNFEKNKKAFEELEIARKFMRKMPTYLDLYTVSIAGFPNVGKSTLMKKMTGSDVEIQSYPFTTKGLMFSYIRKNDDRLIQIIDTPGLLNRQKNNPIEERANIVITSYSASIIFVIDITESCGYSLDQQLSLLKKAGELGKEIKLYLSKTDLYDEEHEEMLETELKNKFKKFKIYRDFDLLREDLMRERLEKSEKFDPKNLKVIR